MDILFILYIILSAFDHSRKLKRPPSIEHRNRMLPPWAVQNEGLGKGLVWCQDKEKVRP